MEIPAKSANATDVPGLELKTYVRILIRQKWLVSLFFLAVVGSVALYTMRQAKVYTAAVSLIIDVAAPRFLDRDVQDVNSDSYSNYWANKEYYETQHRVITSRAVAQRVVDKLGLDADPSFLGLEKITDVKLRAQRMQDSDAAAILQGKVKVVALKESRVTMINIEDSDPKRAALLANEIAEAFVQENLALKLRVTENASQWLDERREGLEQSSKASELAVYNFKKQQDMLTTSLEDRQSMVSQRLVATNAALTDIRLKITGLRARVTAIRSVQSNSKAGDSLWADALPAASEKPIINDLKTKLMANRNDCAELKTRYLDGFPKLTSCVERANQMEKDLVRELNNLVVAAEAELKEATEKEKLLNSLFEQTKSDAFEVNKKQIDFERLKREADQNQRLYDLVFKRIKDIELSGMLRTSNVRVLDPARPVMSPIKPNVFNNMLLAIALGLILGIAGAIFFESLNSTVADRADIEERLGLAFLGIVPSIPADVAVGGKDLFIHHKPKSMVAEFTRAIRTNLLFMSPDKPFRTMVVTSSGPQEGKSTTVINLGIAMAQSGSRVLLLDTDMRRPRLHRAFGVAAEFGVSSLVVGECTDEQAIKTTEVPNLFVLPCGPVPPNPAELLHTQTFRDLLARLSQKFDRIILDSPPIGAVADAVVLATQVDGVLLVVRAGKTQREVARGTVRALRDVNARIFGAVFDDIDPEQSKYGSYYGYGYYAYGAETDKKKEA